ncbi:MAG: membrane fusion protein (multidrug efflux system) [Crocinitomicaceae bacterium]|jgi:membrane fusion protein (multidrug efflux system)
MKRSQIILFAVFLLVSGLIYVVVSSNKKEVEKKEQTKEKEIYVPITEVKNVLRTLSMQSYGQVTPNSEINISFEVQGKLERGNLTMKPGANFRTGQILYRVNNKEAFYTLTARKASLSTMVLNMLPDIELDYPSELDKWIEFLNDLNPQNHLPPLPEMASSKEAMFVTARNINTEYYNLMSLEARMEKYAYAAPFSGTVLSTTAEPGSITSPGMSIARIAKTGNFEVKVPISMADLDLYREKGNATFSDASGKPIATGKILRVSGVINQQTQSSDVYYSIKPLKDEKIYNGMYLNVSIEREAAKNTVTIPRTCLKDGVVMVLENNRLVPVHVLQVHSKPDSLFVTGLKDGQQLVLEQVDSKDGKKNFIGIKR